MKVFDRMSPHPETIEAEASVDQALKLMDSRNIRHLPVVHKGRVVGIVTDGQLRAAWFPSLLEEVVVGDVMTADPLTINAEETVYEAARVLYHNKLTGLLVMESERLVGIITLADILRVFVELMGLLNESVRLDVGLKPGPGSLEEVHATIRAHGGEVISAALVSSNDQRRVYSLRLEKTDLGPITSALREAGHLVLD